jgi:hypothetical protein
MLFALLRRLIDRRYKTEPATRMGWDILRVCFGQDTPVRPQFKNASFYKSKSNDSLTVTWQLTDADGLALKQIHDWQTINDGMGCGYGASGMVAVNMTFAGSARYRIVNATTVVAPNATAVSTVEMPGIDEVHSVRYLPNGVPTCVLVNGAGRPLGPQLHVF